MMVCPNPRLVGKHHQRPLALGPCRDLGIFVLAPVRHQRGILLPCPVQRPLRRKSQALLHHPPQRALAQAHAKAALDQLADDRQRPQRHLEAEVQRRVLAQQLRQLLHLLCAELGRCPRYRLGRQRIAPPPWYACNQR
jgi:hypothetical protein